MVGIWRGPFVEERKIVSQIGYYLGETMLFQAYCVSGNGTNVAAPQSKVLYVELCAPEDYVVVDKDGKYSLRDDFINHFIMVDTLEKMINK